jgi:hypothetical protein
MDVELGSRQRMPSLFEQELVGPPHRWYCKVDTCNLEQARVVLVAGGKMGCRVGHWDCGEVENLYAIDDMGG